jgi:hypothetical protein
MFQENNRSMVFPKSKKLWRALQSLLIVLQAFPKRALGDVPSLVSNPTTDGD